MVFGIVCTVFLALIAVHQTMAARKHQNSNRELVTENKAIIAALEEVCSARDAALNVIEKSLVVVPYALAIEDDNVQRLKALDDYVAAAGAMMTTWPQRAR